MLPGWQVCRCPGVPALGEGRGKCSMRRRGRRRGQGGWRDGVKMGLHKVYLENNETHLPLQYNNNNSSSTWHLSLAAHFHAGHCTKCFT